MGEPRSKKLCPRCEFNMFKEDATSKNEVECELDNDVSNSGHCDDYSKA